MPDTPSPDRWRGIDELAVRVGAYCWVEKRIFVMTGEWAARHADGPDEAELRVWCAATSRRHGARAARWVERLPVRAGVDPDALIAPPSEELAARLDELAAESEVRRGLAGLVEGLLPALVAIYDTHGRVASPVSEGPVLEVLAGAHREVVAEIRGGGSLIGGFGPDQDGRARAANDRETFERLLNWTSVFPAVRTS